MYRKILIKLSGEFFQSKTSSVDPHCVLKVAQKIKTIYSENLSLALVLGGGNIIRGGKASQGGKIERSTADNMGMLATVINSMALQNALENLEIPTRVLSAIPLDKLAEPYILRKALRHQEKKRIVIFAAGTGNPYFSTDTAAVLRAIEMKSDILLKATKVDGVYNADPMTKKNAKKFQKMTYFDVLNRKLKIMDSTAISLCMENRLPLIVFNLNEERALEKVIFGEKIGTLVGEN